ncbi:DUF2249 domain-containing protein [Haloarchaeobius amylolyticus]|uniref:DUF2249 domain-containing protein n=1 Tax=Haloarchaeobius amylolyticus TaxID=1198296 RepID=UPI00226D5262|nr:DUF2249 domain-containing protein [Haloarchaeobius amylolyticus]
MAGTTIDVREYAPKDRHEKIFDAFDDLDSGEALTLVNDHDPQPLYYQLQAERDDFDADGYELDQVAEDEFIATLPKQ